MIKSRRTRRVGHEACTEDEKCAQHFGWNAGRHGWEDNIKMDITKMCEGTDWIHTAQDKTDGGIL
jgi:hypothetical protein